MKYPTNALVRTANDPDVQQGPHRITVLEGSGKGLIYFSAGEVSRIGDGSLAFLNEGNGKLVRLYAPCIVESGFKSPETQKREFDELQRQSQVKLLTGVAASLGIGLPTLAKIPAAIVGTLATNIGGVTTPPTADQLDELFKRPEFQHVEPTVNEVAEAAEAEPMQTMFGAANVESVKGMIRSTRKNRVFRLPEQHFPNDPRRWITTPGRQVFWREADLASFTPRTDLSADQIEADGAKGVLIEVFDEAIIVPTDDKLVFQGDPAALKGLADVVAPLVAKQLTSEAIAVS